MRLALNRLFLLLFALALLPALAFADTCSKCKGLGRVVCKAHDALNVGGLKVGDFACADCLDLECCSGVGWNACPKCKDAKAQGDWGQEHTKNLELCKRMVEVFEKNWLSPDSLTFVKDRKAREKGKPKTLAVPREFLNVMYCRRLTLATDMAGRRVKQKNGLLVLDAHQVHHLYLGRCMEVYQDMADLHRPDAFAAKKNEKEPTPTEIPALRGQSDLVFIFANEQAQRRLTARVFQDESSSPISSPGLITVYEDPMWYGNDGDLHRYLYGALSGSSIQQYNDDPERSEEDRKKDERLPAWITQGFRHALEIRRWGVVEEAGVEESRKVDPKKGAEGWNPTKWPQAVNQLVANGKVKPFGELSRMRLDDMQCSDHQVAWSMTDFLMRKGMDKLAQLIPLLRKPGSDQAQAFREVYGLTQAELEEEWRKSLQK